MRHLDETFRAERQNYAELAKLTPIALTRLINVLKVFVAGVVGQLDLLDVPAFATGCLQE